MKLRAAKVLLVFGVAIFYSFVLLNNTTDYDSNYQFVRHVLMMDTTFPNNHGMWRAINQPALHTLFYLGIIGWETLTMVLCWWGGVRMLSGLHQNPAGFNQSKGIALTGLTLSLLTWLVGFLSIGGEWFLMWQSKAWNGQDAAFRMFTVVGIVMLLVALPEHEGQP